MKKERITRFEIEEDIKNGILHPPATSKAKWEKTLLPAAVMGVLLVILEFLYTKMVVISLTCVLLAIPLLLIFVRLSYRIRANRVSAEDYSVTYGILSQITVESYRVPKGRFSYNVVHNYTAYFDGGKSFVLPEKNYTWSREIMLSAHFMHEHCTAGDEFIIVTKKASGKIAAVYPTEYFEYVNDIV